MDIRDEGDHGGNRMLASGEAEGLVAAASFLEMIWIAAAPTLPDAHYAS